jgi:hypothetical protein
MSSGAVTTRDCIAELDTRYAGWCQCGRLVEKPTRGLAMRPICAGCGGDLASEGILELGDPRVYAILDAVQGARIRVERKRSTVAALEGHFARTAGGGLVR